MPDLDRTKPYLAFIPFVTGLAYIHYFVARESSLQLSISYLLVFAIYLYAIRYLQFTKAQILTFSVLCRVAMFFALPGLSDDFYRFIWDGRLISHGINPFVHVPDFFMQQPTQLGTLSPALYEQLNSQHYTTLYPPVSQLFFWLAALISPHDLTGSVFFLRLIILLFDVGNILLIMAILRQNQMSELRVVIYAFNPLVILELTGNLHFEGIMLFFILGFVYLYGLNKVKLSTIPFSLAIATKLIPLMFLPLVLKKLKLPAFIGFGLLAGGITVLTFFPFLDWHFLSGMSESLDLFFRKFEFNGGLFFLFREIGWFYKGYDMVSTIGPLMSLAALALILAYSFWSKKSTNILSGFTVILFIQLSLATTVHPWYIIPLVAFSCQTNFKFPLVWSALIFLTYAGYSETGYSHPFFLIGVEYIIVLPPALYEISKSITLITSQNK
ncbi:MAG: hypothetical protein RIG77_25840 [Cyclobacteriaceae bacterium]